MLKSTKIKMIAYAKTLQPSSLRAQCYTIANYTLMSGETIAQRIARDHNSKDGRLRAASLMKHAGCATEKNGANFCYGTFHFEDGSQF